MDDPGRPVAPPRGDGDSVLSAATAYSVSSGLAARLAQLGISIAVSSYESNLLYCVGLNRDGGINIHEALMPRPMGICRDGRDGLVVMLAHQVLRLENVLEPGQVANGLFDAFYVPRRIHLTGLLDAHDVGVDAGDRVVFVNTRFNCLATTSNRHSFRPLWRPPFVTRLVDEDRCHLNGLAMQDGVARYVTAASRSDTIDGWRDRRADGGVVVDVASNEVVCAGLSMPHSPRVHAGELWLLNSGTGEIGVVRDGRFEARMFCPGFLRGLAFHGRHAVVGLSRPRYKRFEGLALGQRLREADSEPWCGVQIMDLERGVCVDWLRIDGAIRELYDVEVLPGVSCPYIAAPHAEEAAGFITIAPDAAADDDPAC
ncbi:MAG: TIGR03032 family protein [Gammaproteobacteria bacterium]